MNLEHFRAFLWLRWRIRINQLKRAGIAMIVLLILFAPAVVVVPVVLFMSMFMVGCFGLPRAPVAATMYVWDGLVVGFLFCWAIGLLVELQRSEVLTLGKFLHLPVSIKGAFLINYLSSLVSLNMTVFLPAMVGLSLGLAFGMGPAMLVLLPLVAAFLLMVTALTYQFQGWLASLMVNKRRRRTIVVLVTMGFVVLCQLPNLINVLRLGGRHERPLIANPKANPPVVAGHEPKDSPGPEDTQPVQDVEQTVWLANLCLPMGWLPLGAMAAAEGSVWQGLLGTLGLTLIGAASLHRAYKTTLRLYTGHFTRRKSRVAIAGGDPKPPNKAAVGMLEWELRWLSPETAAIALANFRSLLRAPEAKMMLLTPIIMVVIFGSMLVSNPLQPPEVLRPMMAFGGMAMAMLGMVQLVGNQFGFDRSGFRVYVLCAASRRDILLGKNLAFAPLALGLAAVMALVLECIFPMRVEHLLAIVPQMISMYLLVCLMANCLSILAPLHIAAGSLRPANPKLVPMLMQMVFVMLLPFVLAPTVAPLWIQYAHERLLSFKGWPTCLILSALECGLIVLLYRTVLNWQGRFLHSREQRILEIVASKAE